MALRTQTFSSKPNVFIISDISNEPDDAESLVRYLLYSNQFNTLGLVACTSTWMKRKVCPQDMEKIIHAYGRVVSNLNAHAHPDHPYPSAEYFLSILKTGPVCYGKEALAPDVPLSSGAALLIETLEKATSPVWVLCWGGTNALAQALQHASSRPDFASLTAKLRVYAISDQDDTGALIRQTYPSIFYINSVHAWNAYGLAAWTGISGDNYYKFDQGGPDFSKLTKEWIKENIQIGELGSAYPDYMFIPEGDTPTFLYLIQNGLSAPEHPGWGSWGGRYNAVDASPIAPINNHHHDAVDTVRGANGAIFRSNHATIWRWRDAYQNDFAARMQWTLSPEFASAIHAPVVTVNGQSGLEPVRIEAEAGSEITLDASGTYDPDGGSVEYEWYQYKDVTASQWWVDAEVADVTFDKVDERGEVVKVTLPPPEKCAVELMSRQPVAQGQEMHFILTVKAQGKIPLVTYRRVVVQITNKELRGGGSTIHESIGDSMAH